MTNCVFMHRADSIYDDMPDVQYQFPRQYYGRALQCRNDWIVYLEPTKVLGSRGYFAIARVADIIPDPNKQDMFIAVIEPGSYLEFSKPVPFSERSIPIELGLLNEQGKLSGRAQSAVRPISTSDFERIIERGLDEQPLLPREPETLPQGFEEGQAPFIFEQQRIRIQQLSTRVVRDRIFRRIILNAYDERCAVTGLKLINGGGRAEVNAAHIRPVDKNGPDIVNNGIALSGTAHWMFDRGLISLDDDLRIIVSRQVNDVDGVYAFMNKSGLAIPPKLARNHPHPRFLKRHRENVFKN